MATRHLQNRVEVIDRDGWRKEYLLEKAILHIGSDARNDIVLENGRAAGIEPRHAQIIAAAGYRAYRLVNLSQSFLAIEGREGGTLPPRGSVDIIDGDVVLIGEHRFRFSTSAGSSRGIGVEFHLPDTRLGVDAVVHGSVNVENLGSVPGAQFRISLEGLSPEWYEIGPGPILFPGALKRVPLQIVHARKPDVPAGDRLLTVRVTAPDAYPEESAAASQTVQIAPFYHHRVELTATSREY